MASRKTIKDFFGGILKAVRFKPTGSARETYYSGGSSLGVGLGGICASYWLSHDIIGVEKNVNLIRELCKEKELSLAECRDVVDKFIKSEINPIIVNNFTIQIHEVDLFGWMKDSDQDKLVEKGKVFFQSFFVMLDYWFPLNTVNTVEFNGCNFSLSSAPKDPQGRLGRYDRFLATPGLKDASAWLRVKARSLGDATEKSNIILGAFFLCMHHNTQYQHTMGKPMEGVLYFKDAPTFSTTSSHLPYLANPIKITDKDSDWLKNVDSTLDRKKETRKFVRSLRWLYSSWFATGAEQFAFLCMSVDAATPSNIQTAMAKSGWIRDNLGVNVDSDAIEMIFKRMRADVLHGEAPSLIESQAYLDFIAKYGGDPSRSALAIVCRIIQNKFIPNIRIQPHPLSEYPEYVSQQRQIMAGFGLQFDLPTGFDFQRLCISGTEVATDLPLQSVNIFSSLWRSFSSRFTRRF